MFCKPHAVDYPHTMAIIDVHHHWINEADYLDHLLREMDRLGVERAGLMALGAPFQRLFLTVPGRLLR